MKIKYSALAVAIITATSGQVYASHSSNAKNRMENNVNYYANYYYDWFRPIVDAADLAVNASGVTRTKTVTKTVNGTTTITKTVWYKDGTVITTVTNADGSSNTTVTKPSDDSSDTGKTDTSTDTDKNTETDKNTDSDKSTEVGVNVDNDTSPINEDGPTTEPPVVEPEKPVVEPIADETPISPSYPIVIQPTDPSSPISTVVAPNVPTSGVAWNDKSRGYSSMDPNHKASVTLDGSGVTVAILDSGFNNALMTSDMDSKFENRKTILNTGRYAPSDATHGIQVAEMVAGNTSNGVAKKANLLLADITQITSSGTSAISPTASIYQQLWDMGGRIFNQSFGINSQVTSFNTNKQSAYYYGYQVDSDILSFYKDAINKGGLFVWAAGNNRGETNSSLQAGLPYFEKDLEKGWISVVALAARDSGRLGDFSWSNLQPYSQAGVAKNWTVSAMGDYVFSLRGANYVSSGSSFAAPAVTGTAALVKQKYPWMDGNLLKQSILTTATDIGEVGVDDVYGWGLLDVEKATKGPARFDSRLTLGDDVNVSIPSGSYTFENDIAGDVGLVKNGGGELVLTGASTFTGNTTLNEGAITINGASYGSTVNVGDNGTLATNNTVLTNGVNNSGTMVNSGHTTVENVYTASENSILVSGLDAQLSVTGGVDLNRSTLVLTAEKDGKAQYVTAQGVNATTLVSDDKISGQFGQVTAAGLLNATVTDVSDNAVATVLTRQNVAEYVNATMSNDAMTSSVANNLETSFSALDSQIDTDAVAGTSAFAQDAALLQSSLAAVSAGQTAVLDSLSGQIYASAQALTFQNAEAVNKDLTNRLTMLGTLANAERSAGVWVSGIYGNGKLKETGFGEGKTKTYAGQIGFDKQVNDQFILGTAVNYSTADVSFNRYGGKSDADGVGISLYGRWSDNQGPWYVQGRVGYGVVDSDVERTIILDNTTTSQAKINHKDKVMSGYLETGLDFKQDNFTLTPYIGVSHDMVRRGAFSETNSQFGLTADKATYQQTSGLAGMRMSQAINWNRGMKTTLQGYVQHQTAFNHEDLSFDASYTGLQNADFRVKGIGLAKNKTWVGFGAITEFTPNLAWYVNYDLKLEHDKGKNNVVSTGVRVTF